MGASEASGRACVKGWRQEDAETVGDECGEKIGAHEDRVGSGLGCLMLLFVSPAPPSTFCTCSLPWEADWHGQCEWSFLLSGVWLGLANGVCW